MPRKETFTFSGRSRPRMKPPPVGGVGVRPEGRQLTSGESLLQLPRILESSRRVFFQAARDDRLKVGRNLREGCNRLMDVGVERLKDGPLAKGRPAGQQVIRHRPDAVDVAPAVQATIPRR